MQTYNGMTVPTQIKTDCIVSAFENMIDFDKVDKYTQIMREEMLSHNFPPIWGFPSIIDEGDFGRQFMTGQEINELHLGKLIWNVTDGHHRTLAAIEACLPVMETTLDYSTITNETDFKNFES